MRRAATAAALVLTTITATACTTATAAPLPHTQPATVAAVSARERLAALPVRVEDTGAHYNRSTWGDWTTAGGCTAREAVLRRDGRNVTVGTGCRVTAGRWVSTYDNTTIAAPGGVQIDHRVPVKEALRSGARTWTAARRSGFYNDVSNLVAVSAHANTSKGDRDPGVWRPPNRESWCGYATAYVATKTAYRLAVDQRERDGLAAMLTTCPTGGGR